MDNRTVDSSFVFNDAQHQISTTPVVQPSPNSGQYCQPQRLQSAPVIGSLPPNFQVLSNSQAFSLATTSSTAGSLNIMHHQLQMTRRGPGRPRKEAAGSSPVPRQRRSRASSTFRSSAALGLSSGSCSTGTTGSDASSSCSASPGTPAALLVSTPGSYPVGVTGEPSFSGDAAMIHSQENSSFLEPQPRCQLCNLIENTAFGLGPLLKFKCSPLNSTQFDLQTTSLNLPHSSPLVEESKNLPSSSANLQIQDTSSELTLRINLKQSRIVRPITKRSSADESSVVTDLWEQIGFNEDFDPNNSDTIYIHNYCLLWSLRGRHFEESFSSVLALLKQWRAQSCTFCARKGASVNCKRCEGVEGHVYHVTCAQISGCFMDRPSFTVLCVEHSTQAKLYDFDVRCFKCGTDYEYLSPTLLTCLDCGRHCHYYCSGARNTLNDGQQQQKATNQNLVAHQNFLNYCFKAGWQCDDCKSCRKCKSIGDQTKVLSCEICQKIYHLACGNPLLTSLPKAGWKCACCRKCEDCGSRSPGAGQSSRWHANYTVCDSCYQQRNKGSACPLCGKAYRLTNQKFMRECEQCKKFVHEECDPSQSVTSSTYTCRYCRDVLLRLPIASSGQGPSTVLSSLMPSSSAATAHQQPSMSMAPESELFVGDQENDDDILNDILKSNALHSPMSDLDISCIDASSENFNIDTWTAAVEEELGGPDAFLSLAGDASTAPNQQSYPASASLNVPPPPTPQKSKRVSSKRGGAVRQRRSARGRSINNTPWRQAAAPAAAIEFPIAHCCPTGLVNEDDFTGLASVNSDRLVPVTDGDEYIHTVVVDNADEDFVFDRDMCVVCGSFGRNLEADMIACVQCGQCYHLYCAEVKLNPIIVKRGWRCFNCTICEECGRSDDEQRMLLCDECDYSVHIYCLQPPLSCIPSGSWTCHWCSKCALCESLLPTSTVNSSTGTKGSTSFCPDAYADMLTLSFCVAPKICPICESSYYCCPLCRVDYKQDEPLIRCEKCIKWSHAKCNSLNDENSIDRACELGFKCAICRPGFVHLLENSLMFEKPQSETLHAIDGVLMTKSGTTSLRTRLTLPTVENMPYFANLSIGRALTSSVDPQQAQQAINDVVDSVAALVSDRRCSTTENSALELESRKDFEFLDEENSIKQRFASKSMTQQSFPVKGKFRIGVGGFFPKPLRQQQIQQQKAILASLEQSSSLKNGDLDTMADDQVSVVPDSIATQSSNEPGSNEVAKRRKRQKRKGPLDEMYPSYIQEAFFGNFDRRSPSSIAQESSSHQPTTHKKFPHKEQDQRKQSLNTTSMSLPSQTSTTPILAHHQHHTSVQHSNIDLGDEASSSTASRHLNPERATLFGPGDGDVFGSSSHDDVTSSANFSNILNMLMDEDLNIDDVMGSSANSTGATLIGHTKSVDSSTTNSVEYVQSPQTMAHQQQQPQHQTSNPPQVMMVDCPPPSYNNQQNHPQFLQQHMVPRPQQMQHFPTENRPMPQQQLHNFPPDFNCQLPRMAVPVQQQQQASSPRFMSSPQVAPPTNFACVNAPPAMMPQPPPYGQQPAAPSSFTPFGAGADSPTDDCGGQTSTSMTAMSTSDAKSSLDRWESDEPLGDRATTAAVLYTNLNHPDLKMRFPLWPERAKQIGKLWRLLSPDQRQRFVLLARENRTVSRQTVGKVQRKNPSDTTPNAMENESSSSIGCEMLFKVPNTPYAQQPQMTPPQQQQQMQHFSPVHHQHSPILRHPFAEQQTNFAATAMSPPQQLQQTSNYQQRASSNFAYGGAVKMEDYGAVGHAFNVHNGAGFRSQIPGNDHRVMDNVPPLAPEFTLGKIKLSSPEILSNSKQQSFNFNDNQRNLEYEEELLVEYKRVTDEQKVLESRLAELRRHKKALVFKRKQLTLKMAAMAERHSQSAPETLAVADKLNQSDCRLAELVEQIAEVQRCLDPLKRRSKTNSSSMRDYRRRCGYITPPPSTSSGLGDDPSTSMPISQSPAILATSAAFQNNGDVFTQVSGDQPKRKWVKRKKKENSDETLEKDVALLLMEVVTKVSREVDGAAYDKNQEEFARNSLLKCLLGRNSPVTKEPFGSSSVLKCGTSIAGLKRSTSAAERSPVRKRQRKSLTSTTIALPPPSSSNAAVASVSTPMSPFLPSGSMTGTKIEAPGQRNATHHIVAAQAEMASAHAAFLHQLAIKLQQLSNNSKAAVLGEPAPRRDAFVIQQGVTQLADKVVQHFEKPSITPSKRKSGNLKLSFTPDFYRHRYAPLKARAPIKMEPLLAQNPCVQISPAHMAGNFNRMASLGMRCDTPDDLVIGPANEFDEDLSAASYPALKPNVITHAKPNDNFSIQDGRLSPNFRITAHLPVRAQPADPPMVAFEQMIRSGFHHGHNHTQTKRKEETVSVTLTLTREASTDLRRVLVGLASLLGLDGPSSLDYELRLDTPPSSPALRIKEERDDKRLCKMCNVPITEQGGVKKKWAELGLKPNYEEGEEALFCSSACFKRFSCEKLAAERKMVNLTDPSTSKALLSNCHSSLDEVISFVVEGGGAKVATAVACSSMYLPTTVLDSKSSLPSTHQRSVKPYNGQTILEQAINARDLLTGARSIFGVVSDYSVAKSEMDTMLVAQVKYKGTRWRIWTIADNAKLQAQEYDIQQLRLSLQLVLYRRNNESVDNLIVDKRKCEFCGGQGDDESERCGRLLNFDAARWAHVNCALWSAEVYETVDGGLVNVERAFRHSLGQSCAFCRREERCGATLRCYKLRCSLHFHFACAYDNNCYFLRNKSVYCPDHPPDCADDILTNLAVLRRVYVERDENRLLAKLYQQNDGRRLAMRVGSLIFRHIGQLLPHQLKQFSSNKYIYPAGYDVSRIFWSDKDLKSRKMYDCRVVEDKESNTPKFVINVNEKRVTLPKIEIEDTKALIEASSPTEAWNQILEPIEALRCKNAKTTLKLFPKFLFGEFLYGFVESSVRKMIESLPGVETLMGYDFKFGKNPLMDLPLAVNPSGCARCEPRFRTYLKRSRAVNVSSSQSHHPTMSLSAMLAMSGLGTLESQQALLWASLSGRPPSTSAKWSQYRRMKQEWKNNVYLGRSKIQGLGLYAKKPLEMNTIVIEYIGEIIRNEVAERREKLYQENGRGVYMFRLDHERVVDATMSGGLARYINHSCDPNCTTESIQLNNGESKIVIVACRPISEGEELCYDYQFDLEDDTSKIQCLCGAPNCQKWMN